MDLVQVVSIREKNNNIKMDYSNSIVLGTRLASLISKLVVKRHYIEHLKKTMNHNTRNIRKRFRTIMRLYYYNTIF